MDSLVFHPTALCYLLNKRCVFSLFLLLSFKLGELSLVEECLATYV